ncbi:hypothetical protein [Arthrobacter cupressi]|uniref:Uncharacterized protein n=1 Tax=Arthrobacter cupressi TaxID=1045773 RepID=A0A1G8XA25_9MICC|nr:hypothetical protein [Arthrobacter cupressi]NYD77713.1 hypothetical protein [Arthrobacter cupressi]SDJ87321.1 hypothetical protein SAMN05216555_11851 [Arthrobacter cupressi]
MEDPTTLALNLTFFGTLGLAFLMFLGLAVCMMVTLVLAGVARLLSVIVLAMVGIFPKNDADPVVHLPHSHPLQEQNPPEEPVPGETVPDAAPAETATAAAPLVPGATADRRPGFFESARQLAAGAGTALRSVPWKKLLSPKEWPSPGQLRTKIAEGTSAAVENQKKHHPLLLAATPEPPVLNAEWAAAVAEADAREEARAESQEEAREKSSAGSR